MEAAIHRLQTEVGLSEGEAVAHLGRYQGVMKVVREVTGRVFGIEERGRIGEHALVKWAGKAVRVVMEEAMVMMGKDKARTHAVMMTAFHRKINTGIAGHIQGVLQDGIMMGVNAVIDGMKAGVDTARQAELEGKSAEELTGDEATELGHLQSREYRALQEKVDEGAELTPLEAERFRGYEERIAKTQTVMEQLKRYGAYVKSGRIVPRVAAALTPAVASATMPDSLESI